MRLSRWNDNSDRTMEEIINNMLDYEDWHLPDKDPLTGNDLSFSINKKFDNNQVIKINEADIQFNYIEYEFEKLRPGEEKNEMDSSRLFNSSGILVIYTDGAKTQYITDKLGSGAKTILRKLNSYTGQLEVTSSPYKIDEDLFFWMIYQVLNYSKSSLHEDDNLFLEKIIGFKGSTDDELAVISGNGSRVLNLLSTLAFLFENERIIYIKPRVKYGDDIVEFSVDSSGNINLDLDSYCGELIECNEIEKNSKVILKLLLEVFPRILTRYALDCENEDWSRQKRNEFLYEIGHVIQTKIQESAK